MKYDAAAVVADIRAGLPYAGIATRHGIFIGTVQQVALRNNLRRHKPAQVRTRVTDEWSYPEPTDADGLPEGDWVLDRRARIVRWVAAA